MYKFLIEKFLLLQKLFTLMSSTWTPSAGTKHNHRLTIASLTHTHPPTFYYIDGSSEGKVFFAFSSSVVTLLNFISILFYVYGFMLRFYEAKWGKTFVTPCTWFRFLFGFLQVWEFVQMHQTRNSFCHRGMFPPSVRC